MTSFFFFFNDTATTEISTLSLHDALPISTADPDSGFLEQYAATYHFSLGRPSSITVTPAGDAVLFLRSGRSEEHTSELQSRLHLVCRLLLEKKNKMRCLVRCPMFAEPISH